MKSEERHIADHFRAQVNQIPKLTKAEEEILWQKYYAPQTTTQDKIDIKDRLISSHLKLAMNLAIGKSSRFKTEFTEAFGTAQLGLCLAFNNFDPNIENGSFARLATSVIKLKLIDSLRRNKTLIKTPNNGFEYYLFNNGSKIERALRNQTPNVSPDEVYTAIAQKWINSGKAAEKDTIETLKDRAHTFQLRAIAEISLHAPIKMMSNITYSDMIIGTHGGTVIEAAHQGQITKIFQSFLDFAQQEIQKHPTGCRDWDIFKKRRLQDTPITATELGDAHNISSSAVLQIEQRTSKRMRQLFKNFAQVHRPGENTWRDIETAVNSNNLG